MELGTQMWALACLMWHATRPLNICHCVQRSCDLLSIGLPNYVVRLNLYAKMFLLQLILLFSLALSTIDSHIYGECF
jgi:hypothetical protein